MQTINADATVVDPTQTQSAPLTAVPHGTVASIINIPPQIAVTIFWVAVGFGLCWWLMDRMPRKST